LILVYTVNKITIKRVSTLFRLIKLSANTLSIQLGRMLLLLERIDLLGKLGDLTSTKSMFKRIYLGTKLVNSMSGMLKGVYTNTT